MSGPYRDAGGFTPGDIQPPMVEPMTKDRALKVLAKIHEDTTALAVIREDIASVEGNLAVLYEREQNCIKRINELVGDLERVGNVLRERGGNGPA